MMVLIGLGSVGVRGGGGKAVVEVTARVIGKYVGKTVLVDESKGGVESRDLESEGKHGFMEVYAPPLETDH